MAEQNTQESVKQLTDKELEAILRKSNEKADFPEVKFDEFEKPTYEEWVEACNALLKGSLSIRSCLPRLMKGLPLIRFIHGEPDRQQLIRFFRQMIIRAWEIFSAAQR